MKYFGTYSRIFHFEFEAEGLDVAAQRMGRFAATFPAGECLVLSIHAEHYDKDKPCPDCKSRGEMLAEKLRAGVDKEMTP